MKTKFLLDIQLFAEEGDNGTAGTGTEGGTQSTGSDITIEQVLSTFKPEDILGHASFKSALDSRIGKATNKALENARERWQIEHDNSISESDKLNKMTEREKGEYLLKKEKDQFIKEKEAFERDKLIVETGKQLNELKVDASMAQFIVGKDAESTKSNIDLFTKAFNTSVEKAIEEKIKGGNIIKKVDNADSSSDLESQVLNFMKGR